jgi:hypothetical protein
VAVRAVDGRGMWRHERHLDRLARALRARRHDGRAGRHAAHGRCGGALRRPGRCPRPGGGAPGAERLAPRVPQDNAAGHGRRAGGSACHGGAPDLLGRPNAAPVLGGREHRPGARRSAGCGADAPPHEGPGGRECRRRCRHGPERHAWPAPSRGLIAVSLALRLPARCPEAGQRGGPAPTADVSPRLRAHGPDRRHLLPGRCGRHGES